MQSNEKQVKVSHSQTAVRLHHKMMASHQCKQLLTFVFLVMVFLDLAEHCSATWAYEGPEGPIFWKETYPECGGSRQSPINIQTSGGLHLTTRPHLVWNNYNLAPAKTTLLNNGHTLQIVASRANPRDGKNPHIVIDNKDFELDQTHFHWGKSDKEGSEHTINNKRFPLEMHAVHRRVINGSRVDPPEVIVTTILFELSSQKNLGLERFLKYISNVKAADTSTAIPPFPMDTLIPPFTSYFFFYEGSLTTPPCSEIVTFYIMDQKAPVTHAQLELLRVPLNHEDEPIAGNFRPRQPVNNRVISFVKD